MSTSVLGSQVQSWLEVNFCLNLWKILSGFGRNYRNGSPRPDISYVTVSLLDMPQLSSSIIAYPLDIHNSLFVSKLPPMWIEPDTSCITVSFLDMSQLSSKIMAHPLDIHNSLFVSKLPPMGIEPDTFCITVSFLDVS